MGSNDLAKTVSRGGKYGATGTNGSGVQPAQRSLLLVCAVVCGVELYERIAFYTFNGTEAFFLEHLG